MSTILSAASFTDVYLPAGQPPTDSIVQFLLEEVQRWSPRMSLNTVDSEQRVKNAMELYLWLVYDAAAIGCTLETLHAYDTLQTILVHTLQYDSVALWSYVWTLPGSVIPLVNRAPLAVIPFINTEFATWESRAPVWLFVLQYQLVKVARELLRGVLFGKHFAVDEMVVLPWCSKQWSAVMYTELVERLSRDGSLTPCSPMSTDSMCPSHRSSSSASAMCENLFEYDRWKCTVPALNQSLVWVRVCCSLIQMLRAENPLYGAALSAARICSLRALFQVCEEVPAGG